MTTTTIPTWTLGDRLAKARHHAGISVEQMAVKLGVSRNTITNYEHGRTNPNHATLVVWSQLTGVSLDWIDQPTPSPGWFTAGEPQPVPKGPNPFLPLGLLLVA